MVDTTHHEVTDGVGLRSDAARNRARIVEAAGALFSERGIEVPMTAIARRAGVGIATLFRRFPTREALITEVFAEQIANCAAVLDEAAADPDAWNGFRRLIEFMCAAQIEDRGFTEAFLASFAAQVDYQQTRSQAETAFETLVHRAQRAGRLRPDFAPSDLTLILLANGGLRSAPADHAHGLSRRLVAYLLQAFETTRAPADGPPPLPPPSPLGLHHAHGQPDPPGQPGTAPPTDGHDHAAAG